MSIKKALPGPGGRRGTAFLGYNPCVRTACVLQDWDFHELACWACAEAGKDACSGSETHQHAA
jgi:hypothetical protein